MGLAEKLYGSGDKGVYEIALAEWNYQNNNCFQALVLMTGTIPSDGNKKYHWDGWDEYDDDWDWLEWLFMDDDEYWKGDSWDDWAA